MNNREKFLAALIERTEKTAAARLAVSTAGIAGCGGLGSNIAESLTRAGIKKLILVDFDKVALSNLNRQRYFIDDVGKYKVDALADILKRINPYLKVEKYIAKINSENLFELFGKADIIFEAFDDAKEKSMLINAFLAEKFSDKFLICASGVAGMGSANLIKTKKLNDRVYICGDFESDADSGLGLMSSRVSVVANHQAHIGIRLLTGMTEL